MSEGSEVRASHEEVEGFVTKLKEFHSSLDESGRAMLGTILEGAMAGETGGYRRWRPYAQGDERKPWEDLVGWIEEQGQEDTQGFAARVRI